MRVAVKNHALPVFKKNRIALLLCIFETIILNNCEQNIMSLSLLVGMTVDSNVTYVLQHPTFILTFISCIELLSVGAKRVQGR